MTAERKREEKETMPEFLRWLIRRTIIFFLIVFLAWGVSVGIRRLFF
jgi:hypothetical protein